MKIDWGQALLTIGIAAATSIAAVATTVGLKPSGATVRDYLLTHPEVLPEAMAALEAKNARKAVLGNRGAILTPVGDAWLGNPKGDVTVVQYFDYNCGYCRASLPVIQQLLKAEPNVKLVLRELPVLSQASHDAAKLSYAAATQGKFRAFHDPLYRLGPVTPQTLAAAARGAGVDVAKAKLTDAAAEAEIRRNIDIARQLGISGTPSWVIGDKVLVGMQELPQLRAAIKVARGR